MKEIIITTQVELMLCPPVSVNTRASLSKTPHAGLW